MTRTVHCVRLDKDADGLDLSPYPGELGRKIYEQICKEAWQMWLGHQTMLINEKRLSPRDPQHRKYLEQQMTAFLFGGEVDQAAGYVPPKP